MSRAQGYALFDQSTATAMLVELLATTPDGQLLTYAEMARATNRDIAGKDRHVLTSARRIAQRDYGAVFSPVVREGLRRLMPGEFAAEGRRKVALISRAARRAGKSLDAAPRERMTADERLEHDATRGVVAAIERIGRERPKAMVASRDPVVKVTG